MSRQFNLQAPPQGHEHYGESRLGKFFLPGSTSIRKLLPMKVDAIESLFKHPENCVRRLTGTTRAGVYVAPLETPRSKKTFYGQIAAYEVYNCVDSPVPGASRIVTNLSQVDAVIPNNYTKANSGGRSVFDITVRSWEPVRDCEEWKKARPRFAFAGVCLTSGTQLGDSMDINDPSGMMANKITYAFSGTHFAYTYNCMSIPLGAQVYMDILTPEEVHWCNTSKDIPAQLRPWLPWALRTEPQLRRLRPYLFQDLDDYWDETMSLQVMHVGQAMSAAGPFQSIELSVR